MDGKRGGLIVLVIVVLALAGLVGSGLLAHRDLTQPKFGEVTIRTEETERGPELAVEGQVLLGNKPFQGRNIPKQEGEIGYVHMLEQSGAATSILIGTEGTFYLCCKRVTNRESITISITYEGGMYDQRVYAITP